MKSYLILGAALAMLLTSSTGKQDDFGNEVPQEWEEKRINNDENYLTEEWEGKYDDYDYSEDLEDWDYDQGQDGRWEWGEGEYDRDGNWREKKFKDHRNNDDWCGEDGDEDCDGKDDTVVMILFALVTVCNLLCCCCGCIFSGYKIYNAYSLKVD